MTAIEKHERVVRLLSTTRAEAIKSYEAALAEYENRKAEAVAAIRTRLKNPNWHPFSWVALGIGPPPTHPLSVRF